ncbi:MAG: DUF4364 family protein [Clostridiaceae bacterium]
MFDDTLELAEYKLLVLYIFSKLDLPLSKNKITEIILENNFINYFTLQQYITELIDSGFLKYIQNEEKQTILITPTGKNVLQFFQSRISPDKIVQVNDYLKAKSNKIKEEVSISADYTILKDNNYIVDLQARERDTLLMELKVNVVSNKQARELCQKWRENSSSIYNKIIQTLISE